MVMTPPNDWFPNTNIISSYFHRLISYINYNLFSPVKTSEVIFLISAWNYIIHVMWVHIGTEASRQITHRITACMFNMGSVGSCPAIHKLQWVVNGNNTCRCLWSTGFSKKTSTTVTSETGHGVPPISCSCSTLRETTKWKHVHSSDNLLLKE